MDGNERRPAVLVACGENSSGAPLRLGRSVARSWGADLHVVHVLQLGTPGDSKAAHRLLEILARGGGDEGAGNARIVRAPTIDEGILAEAARLDARLIVVGVKRRGLLPAIASGVAGRVVRAAPCPVLTAPSFDEDAQPDGHEPLEIRKILCPIDFSDSARSALRRASTLAKECGAELVALHVVEPIVEPVEYGFTSMPSRTLDDKVKVHVRARLDELVGEIVGDRHPWSIVVQAGRADETICERAGQDFDLIVLATRGLTGIKHLLLGSVAERVIRRAPCPVFVVKDGD